mgnify:FL=1
MQVGEHPGTLALARFQQSIQTYRRHRLSSTIRIPLSHYVAATIATSSIALSVSQLSIVSPVGLFRHLRPRRRLYHSRPSDNNALRSFGSQVWRKI